VRIFHPLRNPSVALLWSGLSLSTLGDQLFAIALTWIAVGVFGSAAGYLSAFQALVLLLAVLGIGRWADRWHRQYSMVGADLARAAILVLIVTLWLATGAPSAAELVCAILVLAVGQAVFQPALQSVLPSLVSDASLLPAANGLLDTTDRTARLLGPGLIALLAGVLPVVHFLTLDALSFLASATALLLITRRHPGTLPDRRVGLEAVWLGIIRGCRAMRAHPLLGYVLATTGLLSGAWYSVFFLDLPLLMERQPGGDGLRYYGMVLSAYGCTNLAATLFFGGRALPSRPQFQMFSGNLLVGSGMVLMGLASLSPPEWRLPGMLAAAAVGAVGGPMKDIPVAVLRQTRLRPADMAAAMRTYMAANSAGILLAMLLAPAAIGIAGVVPVVVACGAAVMGIGVGGLVRHAGWAEIAPVEAV
jgi:hypothetical protein